jgi:hypothetical protein
MSLTLFPYPWYRWSIMACMLEHIVQLLVYSRYFYRWYLCFLLSSAPFCACPYWRSKQTGKQPKKLMTNQVEIYQPKSSFAIGLKQHLQRVFVIHYNFSQFFQFTHIISSSHLILTAAMSNKVYYLIFWVNKLRLAETLWPPRTYSQ